MKLSCFKCKWLENDINLNTLKKFQTQQHRPTPTVPEEKDKIHSNLRNFLLLKVLTWDLLLFPMHTCCFASQIFTGHCDCF